MALLAKGVATQKELQVVAGGLVYMSMFRRPLLGSLNSLWCMIESFGETGSSWRKPLTLEVRCELFRFLCLVPLARMDFRCRLSDCVTASDASSTGGGLCKSVGLTSWGNFAAELPVRGDIVEEMDVCTVLTIGLFDGIGALRVAADALGLPIVGHVSVEPHPAARRVVEGHFPSSIFVEKVEQVTRETVRSWACRFSQVGLVVVGAGPPCQGVSKLNADRKGALRDHRSSLHSHVRRIYDLVREEFPWAQVHHLMESVKSMDVADRSVMSQSIGTTPHAVDSSGITLCRRPRLYWLSWALQKARGVDISDDEGTGWEKVTKVSLACEVDKSALLTPGWNLDDGMILPTFTTSRPRSHPGRRPAGVDQCQKHELQRWENDDYRYPPYQYKDCNCLLSKGGDRRLPNIMEKEVMMGFPKGYTECCYPKSQAGSQAHQDERHSLIGNSWNVFVVAWLLQSLCHVLGISLDMDLQEVVKQCSPGGGRVLQGYLNRPLMRTTTSRRSSGNEQKLVSKLCGLVSMKGEDILLQSQSEDTLKYHRLRASIPAKLWKWKDVCGWHWRGCPEHINSLEMRAVLTGIRWRLIKKKEIRCKCIHLVDSLVCLHSLARGRSSSRKLRRTLLRINALLLCSGTSPVWAYVHTSQNPADKPSRRPVRKRWVK